MSQTEVLGSEDPTAVSSDVGNPKSNLLCRQEVSLSNEVETKVYRHSNFFLNKNVRFWIPYELQRVNNEWIFEKIKIIHDFFENKLEPTKNSELVRCYNILAVQH